MGKLKSKPTNKKKTKSKTNNKKKCNQIDIIPIDCNHNNSNEKKISILTVSQLKRIPFLHNLLDIIKTQKNVKIFEWVIINGCKDENDFKKFNEDIKNIKSDDFIIKVVSQSKLKYKNIGAFRNLGNKNVSGDIIVCMDDDDFYFPSYIETIVKSFEENKDVMLAGCSGMLKYDYGLDTIFKINDFTPNHTTNCCLAYRKEYIETNTYDETVRVGEERSFLANYFNKMIQLPVMSSIIHMSYSDNTFNDKRLNMLKGIAGSRLKLNSKCVFNPIATSLKKLINNDTIYNKFMELFSKLDISKETDIVFFYGVIETKWSPFSDKLLTYQRRCLELGREFIKEGYSVSVYGQFDFIKENIDGIDFYNLRSFNILKKYKYLFFMDLTGFMPLCATCKIFNKINAEKIYVELNSSISNFLNYIEDYNKDKIKFIVKSHYHILFVPENLKQYDKNNYNTILIPSSIDKELFSKNFNVEREPKRFCYTSKYTNGLGVILKYAWPVIIEKHPDAEFHCYYGMDILKKEIQDSLKPLLQQKGVFDHGRVSHEEVAKEFQRSTYLYYHTSTTHDFDCLSVMEALQSGCIPIIWDKNIFSKFGGLTTSLHPNQQESHIKLANNLSERLTKNKEKYDLIKKINNVKSIKIKDETIDNLKNSKSIISLQDSVALYLDSFNDVREIDGSIYKNQFLENEKNKHLLTNNINNTNNIDLSKYIDSDSSDEDSEEDSKEDSNEN